MYASDREYPSIHRLDVTYKQKLIHSYKKMDKTVFNSVRCKTGKLWVSNGKEVVGVRRGCKNFLYRFI